MFAIDKNEGQNDPGGRSLRGALLSSGGNRRSKGNGEVTRVEIRTLCGTRDGE